MKNLRKVLALVLVVASIMSFALVSNAAQVDFADDATITKAEAVDLLSALGVINGIKQADGTFDFMPEGNVKRGEMAKMIAYILNGGTDIGDLYKAACTYADAKDHWAAGYIAYCDAQDIINGYTDGSYKPNADVTVLEAAKMILCALGYEAEVCGLTGEKWASNVITLALEKNIFSNIDQNATEKATRETAAQMLLNALNATEVEVTAPGSVTVNGVVITTGNVTVSDTGDYLHEHFDSLVRDTAVAYGEFGVPGYQWTLNGSAICWTPWTLVASYTNNAKYADMSKAIGGVTLSSNGSSGHTFNGKLIIGDTTEVPTNLNKVAAEDSSAYTYMTSISANYTTHVGRTGDLYFDAATKTAIFVVKQTFVGKIVLNDKGDKYQVQTLAGAAPSYNNVSDTEWYANTEGFAKDDIVTYNFTCAGGSATGVRNVQLATVVTADLTNIQKKTNGDLKNFALGSTYYVFNGLADAASQALVNAANLDKSFTAYLDEFGNVVYMTAVSEDVVAPTTGYAIVEKAATQTVGADIWGDGASTTYLARLRGVDGNLTQVTVKADAETLEGDVVKFTVGTDGKYTLVEIAAPAAEAVASGNIITNKNAILDLTVDAVANTKTTFVVETVDTKGVSTWTVYEGIEAVPTIVKGDVVALDKDGAKIATANTLAAIVFVKNADIYSAPAAATELNLSMIRLYGGEESSFITVGDKKVEVFSNVKAMINGEATLLTISRDAHTKLTKRDTNGINYITEYKVEDGIVTDVTVATLNTDYYALTITEAYKDGLMVLDDNTTYVAKGSIPAYVYQYNYGVFAEMSLDELPATGQPNGEAQPNQYVAVKNASGAIVAVFGFATV